MAQPVTFHWFGSVQFLLRSQYIFTGTRPEDLYELGMGVLGGCTGLPDNSLKHFNLDEMSVNKCSN